MALPSQEQGKQETTKATSSSRPVAAEGQDEAIDGNSERQKAHSTAEEKRSPECPLHMEDEQELRKDSRGEVEDVFARLKKHRKAKAVQQASF